jgi:ABC-type transport system substrate-binding protein
VKRLTVPVVILLALVFIISGCSSTASPTTTAPAANPTTTAPAVTTSQPPTSSAATTTKPAITTPTSTAVPTLTASSTATVPPAVTGNYGGTLRYVLAAGPGTPLTPWETTGGTIQTSQFVIQPLLREDLPGTLVGVLATSWDQHPTDNPPNIVFKLRQGVKFGDGTDFNAQAVKWKIGRAHV